MIAKQKQMVETFVRVRAFVAAHPVTGPLSYGSAPETLDDVVPRVREHAGVQITGRALSSAELRVQAKLVKLLMVRHMRPIAAIARAQIDTYVRHRRTGHVLAGSYRQVVTYRGNEIWRIEEYHDAAKMAAFWRLVASEETAGDPQ